MAIREPVEDRDNSSASPLNQALRLVSRDLESRGFDQEGPLCFVYEEGRTLILTGSELPLVQPGGTVVPHPIRPIREPSLPAPTRILLVEDDPELARCIQRVLKLEGVHVAICNSCAEAEKVSEKFQSAVFDVSLPDGSGLDLAHRLKDRIQQAVFYSATSDIIAVRRAQGLGLFVSKATGMAGLRSALGLKAPV